MTMYTTETKRGRPKTGRNPSIKITVPKDLLRQIDEIAGAWAERRGETIRLVLKAGVRVEKELLAKARKCGALSEDWP